MPDGPDAAAKPLPRRRGSSSNPTRPRRRSPGGAARSQAMSGTGGCARKWTRRMRSSNLRSPRSATGAAASASRGASEHLGLWASEPTRTNPPFPLRCSNAQRLRCYGDAAHFAASNSLLAQNVMDRYVFGMTVGTISSRTGLSKSAILSEDARLSEILKPCTDRLLELYRAAPVKGADETTWSCDGQRGYVYGFFTPDIAVPRFARSI